MLSIPYKSGLLSLPPELWLLIGTHLLGDPASLKVFAELNRHAFTLINAILYEEVTRPEALATLAKSNNFMQRFKAQHPAAFIKHLHLDFRHPKCVGFYDQKKHRLLEGVLQQTFMNIIEHASISRDKKAPSLATFKIDCSAPFLQLFGEIDFGQFSFEMLSIRCLPPPNSTLGVEQCCMILEKMLKPCLYHLSLGLGDNACSGQTPLFSHHSGMIFRQIARSASNLQTLQLVIPRPPDDESDEVAISTLNKTFSEIYFPNLLSFAIQVPWGLLDPLELLDITPFLRRHSLLLHLCCDMSTVDHGYSLIKGPLRADDLPDLTLYRGLLDDYLAICADTQARHITTLHLYQVKHLRPEVEQRLIECLECLGRNLDTLTLDGRSRMKRDRSLRWLDFTFTTTAYTRVFGACTNLTSLACNINTESLQAGFILLVVEHLPLLEELTLCVVDTRESCDFEEVQRVVREQIWRDLRVHAALPFDLNVDYYYHLSRTKVHVRATLKDNVLCFKY